MKPNNIDSRIIFENGEMKHVNYDSLVARVETEKLTLLDLLRKRVNQFPNDDFLGGIVGGRIEYMSNTTAYEKVTNLASFLGQITAEGDNIGLLSNNRPEWIIAEYAGYMINCPNVPLYSSFQSDALISVITEANLKIIVSSADKMHFLLQNVLKDSNLGIGHILLMDFDEKYVEEFAPLHIQVYDLKKILMESGGSIAERICTPDSIASICYTSGTTGEPKGVVLTHKNFISQTTALNMPAFPEDMVKLCRGESYISYLPLAHVFERIVFAFMIDNHIKVGFYRGQPKLLQEDFEIIRPTFVGAVPRVLNVFQSKIQSGVDSSNFIVRWIFNKAMKLKLKLVERAQYTSFFLDRFVFRKVSEKFGGNIKYILVGGASLNPSVKDFLQSVLSCHICMGYGQTESLAASTIQPMSIHNSSTIGIPYVSTRVKIQEVDGYEKNSGHLLLKGPAVTQGYYKREEQTAELFTEDGWLKTGDIVKVEDGLLYTIGREKEIFKTSYGEYIVPERLENLFTGGHIEDIYIAGGRYSDKIMAIVVCSDESVKEMDILLEIQSSGNELFAENKLNKYEIPEFCRVVRKPFIEYDNGVLLTPSFKKKRRIFDRVFQSEITSCFGKDK